MDKVEIFNFLWNEFRMIFLDIVVDFELIEMVCIGDFLGGVDIFVGSEVAFAFHGFDGFAGEGFSGLDVDGLSVGLQHVDLPRFEPFVAHNVADKSVFLFVEQVVPFIEVLHQILL